MGNEASCSIVGIGDVRIIMFDGIVRTLTGVLHVSSMNRHLISLATLDEEGFVRIDKNVIPISSNKSMGCMDLVGV